MAIRLTYFFKGTQSIGWTETWFDSAGSVAAALAKADTQLRPARLGVLASSFALRQIRASDESVLRDSLIKSYTQAQGVGLANPGVNDPNDWGPGPESFAPQTALLVRMEAGALNRRMFLLRGVPLGPFGADLVYNPSAIWIGLFNAFANAFTGANGHQLRIQTAGPVQVPTNISVGGGGVLVTITLPGNAPAGWNANATIKLSKFVGAAFINGNWRISQTSQPGGAGTPTTITFYPKNRQVYGTPVNTGFAQLISPSFANFTAAIPLRGAKKNTGRPFDLLRGRARVRRS